jgi:hypothetical protein
MSNTQANEKNESFQSRIPELRRSWLSRALGNLNFDFPLSGGQNDNDFIIWQSKDRTPKENPLTNNSLKS